MNPSFEGRTALVTAASEGLGLAAATKIAAGGARVAICGRDRARLASAKQAIDAAAGAASTIAIAADLTEAADIAMLVEQALAQLGQLDVLVVNTGHMPYGTVEDLDDDAWQSSFDLILMSAVRLTRLVVPHMRRRKTGDIVYVTSAGTREASPHLILSNAFRAGIMSLAKTLSQAVAADGVRVNVVAPGYFDTGRVRRRIDELSSREGISRQEASGRITGGVPMGRIGQAEEFGALVAFAASREVPFMTGSTLVVDGGTSRCAF